MQFERDLTSFYFDPRRDGYSASHWFTLSGSPTVAASVLRFNGASSMGRVDLSRGELTFNMLVPAAPSPGDSRKWGLNQVNMGSSIVFDITDAVFSAKVTDGQTGKTDTSVIAWETGWTGTPQDYRINWGPDRAEFFVDDIKLAVLDADGLSKMPMSFYVYNNVSDNLDLAYLDARSVELADEGFFGAATMAPDLVHSSYDYVGVTWNGGTFTETYTFKVGGVAGTTVATLSLVYTDGTKATLVSCARS